jgi:hypothetical protein
MPPRPRLSGLVPRSTALRLVYVFYALSLLLWPYDLALRKDR